MINENNHGVSPVRHSKLYHKTHRFLRTYIGKAGVPFDWSKGIVRPMYNIKNQYTSSSCWGQMFSRMIQIIQGCEELSAKSAYSPIYVTGGGVNLPDGENEAKNIGLTTEKNVPSVFTLTNNQTCTEYFMEDTSWRTLAMIRDSATRAGYDIVNIAIDVDSVAQAIRDYGTVGILLRGNNNGSWTSAYPKPPQGGGSLWGHYLAATGNIQPQLGTKWIPFYNSWGTDVGEKGIQYFNEIYFNSGFIIDVFTFQKKQVYQSDDPIWWKNFLNLLRWLRNNQTKVVTK